MRRVHVKELSTGPLSLDHDASHHLHNVLRMTVGDEIELFDAAGRIAHAKITSLESGVQVSVESISEAPRAALEYTIAAAIPKANRADWMIEKLSELGVAVFIPLAAERSVVLPEGTSKRQRWERIAAESAQQSRRPGVMKIEALTRLGDFLRQDLGHPTWCLSTTGDAIPVLEASKVLPADGQLTILVGPEGGWTDAELALFRERGLTSVSLGPTILRVETAAVAAAAIASAILASR